MNKMQLQESFFLRKLSSDFSLSLLILLIALASSLLIADGRYGFGPDGAREINLALNIVDGKGINHSTLNYLTVVQPKEYESLILRPAVTKPPLYSYLIAGLVKVGISAKWAGWIISQGAFSLSAVLLFSLARSCMPKIPSLIVGISFCFLISTSKWGITIKEDSLYLAMSLTSLLWFTKLRELKYSQWISWLGLGVLTALGVLTRYMGISLVIAIALVITVDILHKKLKFKQLILFFTGLGLVSWVPFMRFLRYWIQGIRPSFFEAIDTTWYQNLSLTISTLQIDLAGSLYVWIYDQSKYDLIIVIGFILIFVLVFYWALQIDSKLSKLSPITTYIFFYLLVLNTQLALKGHPGEERFIFPVEGLLILILIFIIWMFYRGQSSFYRVVISCFSILLMVFFINGQRLLFNSFKNSPAGPEASREMCPSPKSLAWIKHNIPVGEIILGNQCSFQLLAETNDYAWMPIPPADEYKTSPLYKIKLQEKDFLRIKQQNGAQWIVLFLGESGDPRIDKPGYGDFVSKLHQGHESSFIKLQAKFSDGLIYQIK